MPDIDKTDTVEVPARNAHFWTQLEGRRLLAEVQKTTTRTDETVGTLPRDVGDVDEGVAVILRRLANEVIPTLIRIEKAIDSDEDDVEPNAPDAASTAFFAAALMADGHLNARSDSNAAAWLIDAAARLKPPVTEGFDNVRDLNDLLGRRRSEYAAQLWDLLSKKAKYAGLKDLFANDRPAVEAMLDQVPALVVAFDRMRDPSPA